MTVYYSCLTSSTISKAHKLYTHTYTQQKRSKHSSIGTTRTSHAHVKTQSSSCIPDDTTTTFTSQIRNPGAILNSFLSLMSLHTVDRSFCHFSLANKCAPLLSPKPSSLHPPLATLRADLQAEMLAEDGETASLLSACYMKSKRGAGNQNCLCDE